MVKYELELNKINNIFDKHFSEFIEVLSDVDLSEETLDHLQKVFLKDKYLFMSELFGNSHTAESKIKCNKCGEYVNKKDIKIKSNARGFGYYLDCPNCGNEIVAYEIDTTYPI